MYVIKDHSDPVEEKFAKIIQIFLPKMVGSGSVSTTVFFYATGLWVRIKTSLKLGTGIVRLYKRVASTLWPPKCVKITDVKLTSVVDQDPDPT